MMCVKKWNVERGNARLQVIAVSFLNVNVTLGGRKLFQLMMMISSFSLV